MIVTINGIDIEMSLPTPVAILCPICKQAWAGRGAHLRTIDELIGDNLLYQVSPFVFKTRCYHNMECRELEELVLYAD